jgi:hypothetical protein
LKGAKKWGFERESILEVKSLSGSLTGLWMLKYSSTIEGSRDLVNTVDGGTYIMCLRY